MSVSGIILMLSNHVRNTFERLVIAAQRREFQQVCTGKSPPKIQS